MVVATRPFATRPVQLALRKKVAFCIECDKAVATTAALFKVEGAIIVRKYCDACIKDAVYKA
jgi:hypothetical protein